MRAPNAHPLAALALLAGVMAVAPASADDDWVPPITDPLTQAECGDCHMAFQPGFLPARSWHAIMDNLKDHFGDNATLAEDKVALIRAYLTENAGDRDRRGLAREYMAYVRPDGVPLKITENPAFRHEHDFPARVWQRPEVMTPSNCLACHRDAERGYFED